MSKSAWPMEEGATPHPGSVTDIPTRLPLKRRIAFVRLWPERPVAEHECLQRLAHAARRIGLDVVDVDRIGFFFDGDCRQIGSDDVDFVVHLHYETAKTYDCFSFGALWNPIDFYFDWGFKLHASNQISHDDFFTAGATAAEDMIVRARPAEFRRGSFPLLSHSLCEPIIRPRMRTDRRTFYCGINWERVGGKPGRHSRFLKTIDEQGLIDIYGPNEIEGIHPWEGFKGYRRPLPFDGVSLIRAASEAGAVLVLSSEAHKRAGIMSSRLFECLASGSLIIGDSHPFLRQHFADCALFVDDTRAPEEQGRQAIEHLGWANANPERALEMIERAQARFIERFALDRQLLGVYRHFVEVQERRVAARAAQKGRAKLSICVVPIDPRPMSVLGTLESLARQTLDDHEVLMACGSGLGEADRARLAAALPNGQLKLVEVGPILDQPLGNLGAILAAMLPSATGDAVSVSLGIERYFASFVETIMLELSRQEDFAGVRTMGLLEHFAPDGRRCIDLNDPGWQSHHPALVCAIAIRRQAYEEVRPLLDYVDAHNWMRLLSLGAAGSMQLARTPLAVAPLPEFENAGKRFAKVPPLLAPDRIDQLVATYVSPRRSAAGGAPLTSALEPAGPGMDMLRGVVAQEVEHRISADTIGRLTFRQREALAIALFDALPVPGLVKGSLRRLHKMYIRTGEGIRAMRKRRQGGTD